MQKLDTDAALEERVSQLVEAKLAELLPSRLEQALIQREPQKVGPKRLAIVASKGTLDMAYPPLILATAAAAMGWEVSIFFTFYGLDIINRKKLPHLKVAPLANPAMPVPMPNILGALPGMTAAATAMMKHWFQRARIPSIEELLEMAKESGVRLISCTTTMGVMGVGKEDIISGATLGGAAAFLDYASQADVALFI